MAKKNKTKLLKIVFYGVGKAPEVREIEDSLDAFKAQIGGGWIEAVNLYQRLGPRALDLYAICDEEGLLKNMPHNRLDIHGDFFVTRVNAKGDNITMTDDDILNALTVLK
jgi:hypothetical protein